MYFLSDIVGVGCERPGIGVSNKENLFFTISVRSSAEHGDQWSILYRSDVLSGQKNEWQPLPRAALFPVGMPSLRSARQCRIHVYAMRDAADVDLEYSRVFDMTFSSDGDNDDDNDDLMVVHSADCVGGWHIGFIGHGDCRVHRISDPNHRVPNLHLSIEMNDGEVIPLVESKDKEGINQKILAENQPQDDDATSTSLLEKLELTSFGNISVTVTERFTFVEHQPAGRQTTTPTDIRVAIQKMHALQHAWQAAYDDSKHVERMCRRKQKEYRHVLEKQKRITSLKNRIRELQSTHERLEDAKEKHLKKLHDMQEESKIKSQALIHTLQALVQASSKVCHSKQALEGVQGQGRIDGISTQLDARRRVILKDLGRVYDIRASSTPTNALHMRRQPTSSQTELEARMDITWSGASDGESMIGRPQTSAIYTVRGQRLDPASWKHAFDAEGYQWDAAIDRESSIALGYAAHMVAKMSEYLDVPLRYPIVFKGSHSTIIDTYRPAGQYPDADTISEFPLFCLSNKDRPRFAIAVFLLNKDVIQLLQAYNIPPHGPSHVLQNLDALISASSSGASSSSSSFVS
ncbi:hypothetical protein M9435_003962 [Picochlorum sp. BPE23]|nr:hypothetical protein M9435_003962 [Picochlorum sp. BPE23]